MTNKPLHTLAAYSEEYKESCFTTWYSAGRPSAAKEILEIIPEDNYGRRPNIQVLRDWRNDLGWDLRADELDAKAIGLVEDELVNRRVIMLKEQASRAREIQTKAMDYLRDKDFDTSSSAVSAIIRGAELERTSLGLSDAILKLGKLTDGELTTEAQRLIQRLVDSGEVIDVAEILKEDEKELEDAEPEK